MYNSFVDQATIEEKGLAPAKADLTRLGSLKTYEEVAAAMGDPKLTLPTPFNLYIDIDAKDPNTYAVAITQGGLGLPDRDYYLRDDEQFPQIRKDYVAAIAKMLARQHRRRRQEGAVDPGVEHALAEVQWPVEQQRDADKTYNPVTRAELDHARAGFPWALSRTAQLAVSRNSSPTRRRVPKFAERLPQDTALDLAGRTCSFHYLQAFAPYLPKAIDDANFAFFGTRAQRPAGAAPRWKRGVDS